MSAETALPRERRQSSAVATLAWLLAQLVDERERWLLWLPAGLGVGIAGYFALRVEPPPWAGPGGLAAAAAFAIAGLTRARRWRPALLVLAIGLGAPATGFTAAQLRSAAVAAPVLQERLTATLTARVVSVQPRVDGDRLVLTAARVTGLDPAATPARLRLSVRDADGASARVRPGDWVRLRATLLPPPGPAAPGAFDFQRRAWFQRLGAVGFSRGKPVVVAPPDGATAPLFAAAPVLADIRQRIFFRVTDRLDGATGAIAAALMMGERGAIPEDVLAAMRDSGLAHLLAISGLHVGLVAGILFFAVRGCLALVPAVALRFPIKKWAAVVALIGAFGYLLLAGAPIPTQRAFVMVGLVLVAVLVDRRGISMRLVVWAATFILLVRPESLLGASFQLSFAAVLALVAGYEALGPRLRVWYGDSGVGRRVLLYVAGVALTTVIAGLATAPFALFHFNRVVVYSLAANLVAVPLTALWVMPWAVAALVLMPLGWEGLALVPMGWGVDGVIAVARAIAGWPGAVRLAPALPTAGLIAVAVGGLWLCLWRRPWRLAGLGAIVAGLVTIAGVHPPDVMISADARLAAVRGADGMLLVSHGRRGAFTRGVWLRRAGASDWSTFAAATAAGTAAAGTAAAGTAARAGTLRCDRLGCTARLAGQRLAIVADPRALTEDCRHADVIVSFVPVRGRCPRPHTVVDRFDVHRDGSHAVWLAPAGARVAASNPSRGDRPRVPRVR